MITESQVVVTTGIIIVVAVVSWCASAWWSVGRYEEIIAELEGELKKLKARSARFVRRPWPPEVAHPPEPVLERRAMTDSHSQSDSQRISDPAMPDSHTPSDSHNSGDSHNGSDGDEWIRDMTSGMDAWIAENVYSVPFSVEELWTRQAITSG
jgi:hypothetical protein